MGLSERNRKLGLIHVAKKQCRLTDDEYRCLLQSAAGVSSASQIESPSQFQQVMNSFKRIGFSTKRRGWVRITDAQLAKCYVLWKQLHAAGAVESVSYASMMSWMKKRYGFQDIMNGYQKSHAIEALKKWLERFDAPQEAETRGK